MTFKLIGYVARNKDNSLHLYSDSPSKFGGLDWWQSADGRITLPENMYIEVKWKNRRPLAVDLLITDHIYKK